jgi:phage baseplate assembly protein gpV
MFNGFWESVRALVRAEVERVLRMQLMPHYGNAVAWDPKAHAAKVTVQPENKTTNWVPVSTQWAGNGWGDIAGLSEGEQVKLIWPEYGSDQASVVGRYFDSRNPPPQGVQPGERWIVHQSGSMVQWLTGGKIVILANGAELDLTGKDIVITATDKLTIKAPNVEITGNLQVDQNLTVNGTTTTVQNITIQGIESGGGPT